MKRFTACLAVLLTLALAAAPRASTELSVTVTLTGDLDEIIEVLQRLRRMGIGGTQQGANREEGLRLQIRSVHENGGTPGSILDTLMPEPEPKPEPVLKLEAPAVDARELLPGSSAQITVRAIDPKGQIDTITVGVKELSFLADLRDDGRAGDEVADDDVWWGLLTLRDDAAPGEYVIEFSAYGAYGALLMVENKAGEPEPLRARTVFTVPEPPPLPDIETPPGFQGGYDTREEADKDLDGASDEAGEEDGVDAGGEA